MVQQHLFNDRYDAAHQVLDSLIAVEPADPIGYVYRAAVYLDQMTDAEEPEYGEVFKAVLDSIFFLSAKWPSGGGRDSAWMYLCQGHAYAYRSLWESRFGSLTSAIKQAFNARSAYEAGLVADSSLYDLYGGLGMYHYWKSAKAGLLRWLGLFKNEKDKGIKELYLAMDSSRLSKDVSRNAMIWIWLDREQYDSVIVTCLERLTVFPEGRLFLWPLAEAYFKKKDYARASEVYSKLRRKLSLDPGNYYNLLQCDYSLNQCYHKLGQEKPAVLAARNVSDYYPDIPDHVKRRQRSKIDFLRRVARREIR